MKYKKNKIYMPIKHSCDANSDTLPISSENLCGITGKESNCK